MGLLPSTFYLLLPSTYKVSLPPQFPGRWVRVRSYHIWLHGYIGLFTMGIHIGLSEDG